MKKRWKLSRGRRTALNLTLAALLHVLIWGMMGYPLPTAELEFRRLEREHLLAPSDIQGIFRDQDGDRNVAGVQAGQVVLGSRRELVFWPREGLGPALVPVESYDVFTRELAILAVDVPQGTRSARLEAAADCWYTLSERGKSFSAVEGGYPRDDTVNWLHWARDYRAEGELLKEGGVLFRVHLEEGEQYLETAEQMVFYLLNRHYTYRQSREVRGANCHMEAIFYSGSGAELGRAVLATPEEGDAFSPSNDNLPDQ